MNKERKVIVIAILMFVIFLELLGLHTAHAQTRGFIDTQFGSTSGLGYQFPHLAVGAGFDYDFWRNWSVRINSDHTITYSHWPRLGFEVSGDFSPDRKYGLKSGSVVTGGGFGDVWLTHGFGLTAGAEESRLQTPEYHKAALIPEAGLAFRFTGAGFPMRLYTNWVFPTGKYDPATGIEPNRLRGPELFWETQLYSHVAVGLRFGMYKGYSQGNPLCDGTLGLLTPSCARGTFTQGIMVLHIRFTTKVVTQ